ncbi:MAG TPA: type I polyketide synthase [Gemmataceae bacterium]|nr:type I polyketide synthase [Gemmataceae bacterium]
MIDNQTNGHPPKLSFAPALSCSHEPLALIGIGCRFPGNANDPASFWQLLANGVDAVSEVPPERWNKKSFYDPETGKPGKSHACWGGFVENIDRFDPAFFGISPREAAHMDPQQRLLLETAWEALEDGGQVQERLSGSNTAVFVGISSWEYSFAQISFRDRAAIDVYTNTGGSLSIAANRISYCFDLRGPSVAVDTACSSALVAVHLACKSIWEGGCPLALAGGVNALLLPDWYVGFSRLGMLSPDGRCHAFDAAANGFVRSEGAGMVVLRPLSRALADGDRIYAVIRGTAVNQDGRTPGLTVPSEEAQTALLRQAYHNAGVAPAEVQYIEAHGTGTLVGDPIEARALGSTLSAGRPAGRPCLVGSVKTNIGHLEAGSGIAGLIKTALALHHRRIPGNLHFHQPNPAIDFAQLRLRVPVHAEPWPASDTAATAGVNSFGYGGTNAHVVLQEAPQPTNPRPLFSRDPKGSAEPRAPLRVAAKLLPLSARSPQALRALANAWQSFVADSPPDVALHDLAYNAAHRRSHHDHRLALVAHSRKELSEQLAAFVSGQAIAGASSERGTAGQRPRLAFVCSGQGPQWWAMGRQLLEQEPVFRTMIERCDEIMRGLGSWSLVEELTADEEHSRMAVTAVSQPAIFALQAALAALWRSWGVQPEAVIGHSVGEVAAAHLAGVFSLEDAVRVIYQRGRCMELVGGTGVSPVGDRRLAGPTGRMIAASITPEEATRLIAPYGERVSLAAVNSPASVTLSGDAAPLEEIARALEQRQVFCRFLQVQYAFHSAQMDPVRDELLASLHGIQPRTATLPLFSTVSGQRIDGREMGPDYWWRNVRQTVQFAGSVEHILNFGCDTVVELSPHPVLTTSVSECYGHRGKSVQVMPSLRRREDERATILRSLGLLYTLGQPVDWTAVTPGPARTLRLPRYPWQREQCWFESEESRITRLAAPAHPLLGTSLHAPQPTWQTRLDLRLLSYLNDHRVQGTVVFPATGYIEMALAVAREVFGTTGETPVPPTQTGETPVPPQKKTGETPVPPTGYRLDDIKLTNPCFVTPDRPRWLRATFHPEDATVRICSRAIGVEEEWTAHAAIVLRRHSPQAASPALSPEAIRQRCPQAFAQEECYAVCRKTGLDYGPLFQGITGGRRGNREALTEVYLSEGVASEDYLFHPALLDACFQSIIPANDDFQNDSGKLYLPVEVEQVRLLRRSSRRVWCHVRIREQTARSLLADLDIYDEEHKLAAQIRGFRSQRVSGDDAGDKLDDLLYAHQWQSFSRDPKGSASEHSDALPFGSRLNDGGGWLIFADRSEVGEQLAKRLRDAGATCTLVFAGTAFARRGEDRYEIDPSRGEDMTQLMQAVLAPGRPPCRGIVHLWNLDSPSADALGVADLEAAQEAGLFSVLYLVQAWEKTSSAAETPLVLVTRGAQSVGDKPMSVAVAQSPAIGLGRVIANECSRLRGKTVDLDPADKTGGIASLFDELMVQDDEDEIALRGGVRYVQRLVPSTGETAVTVDRDEPYRLAISPPGSLDDLTPRALRRQPPAPGQIEIEVVAAGLNFSDVLKALGIYPGLGDGPLPLGAECSGRISAIGEGVNDFRIGDEVLAVAPFSFGSHVVTRAELAVPKPPRWSFEEAATLPIAFLTAAYALEHLGHLSAGERVLIHSATGGVGLAAVQLARRAGAEIFATAGTPEKRDYLKSLGIAHVMDSRSLAFADEVMEQTNGRGVDVVLNSLAGEALVRSVEILADYGRFLEIGKRDVYGNSRLGLRPFRKNLSFHAIDLDRVIRERPALLGRLLRQIVRDAEEGRLTSLPHRVYPIAEAVSAFRFMQHSKHIGKIVLSMRKPQSADATPLAIAPTEEPITFRADATYLITGGLGGFGLAVARWMVERGARHLALLGRRGIHSDRSRQAVAELKQRGAHVVVHRADVAQENDLAAVLAQIARDGPPLRGVFHAAMVLEDALLLNLDRERMRRVLVPKVQGTWNLHRQTLDHPLDFFVMFSSLSSVFGHAGQGNYAAANLFLDALAWHRRAHNLPALTVNWGYLGEVGYLAERPQLGEWLERRGVRSFTVRQALTLLERALQRRAIQVGVMRVDWSRWRGLGVAGRVSPRFAHLLRQENAACGLANTATKPQAASLDSAIRNKVARVLGTSPDRLDDDKPLLNLGIDSLMAVELRNWIEQELRVNVPIMELMRSPSLARLTDLLLDHCANASANDAAPKEVKPADEPVPTEDLLTKIADLSDEDVDALLLSLLNKSGDRSTTP